MARLAEFKAPILALIAGADAYIKPEANEEFRRAVEAADPENEVVVYPGAPHSFFDRAYEQYQNECADAWRCMQAFIEKHSAA